MGPTDVGQNDNFGVQYNPLIDEGCDCCEGCGWPLLCSRPTPPISAVAPMAPGDSRRDGDPTISSASDKVIAAAD